MDPRLSAILDRARERFPEGLREPEEVAGEVSISVDRAALLTTARFLHAEGFTMLADWSAVDHLGHQPPERRFLCAAHLLSIELNLRLRLRVWLPEGDETCPSLTGVWPAANYMEREMYDFFGVTFEGHPEPRRIFMPDEWEGHPQRKDYPLGGTNTPYRHGHFIPPPDVRSQPTTTTGYPGRTS